MRLPPRLASAIGTSSSRSSCVHHYCVGSRLRHAVASDLQCSQPKEAFCTSRDGQTAQAEGLPAHLTREASDSHLACLRIESMLPRRLIRGEVRDVASPDTVPLRLGPRQRQCWIFSLRFQWLAKSDRCVTVSLLLNFPAPEVALQMRFRRMTWFWLACLLFAATSSVPPR